MAERRTNEIATAVGLAAYVLLLFGTLEAWKLTRWLGLGIPYELLAIPSVLAALVIHPAAEWARDLAERRARRSTTGS
jgi:hypothetical protein